MSDHRTPTPLPRGRHVSAAWVRATDAWWAGAVEAQAAEDLDRRMRGMIWLGAYAASIVAANWMISAFGLVPVGFGLLAPAGVYAAGLSFWLRDQVHESVGAKGAVLAVVAGAALSALLSPSLALASGTAFLVSELADLVVYAPLRERRRILAVALSNTVGSVVDSILFVLLAFGSLDFVAGNVLGKWWTVLPVVIGLWVWRRRCGTSRRSHGS